MAKFLFYDTDIINILVKNEQPSGGAAVQSFVWIQGLVKLGHEVVLIKDTDDHREIKPEWAHLKIVPVYSNTKGIKWIRWIYYRFPKLFFLLQKEHPDYVYESNPGWNYFFTAIICRFLKIRLITRIPLDAQLDPKLQEKYSYFHSILMNNGIKLSYCILCQNDFQMKLVNKKFPGKKTLKIYNPFILKSTNPLTLAKREYIAWLANFRYQKNIKLLYEIASLLKNENFKIAGSASLIKDAESAKYLEKLNKLPNVTIIGFIPRTDVINFLSNAKFLLNTSRYEGFSNTFLEAMNVGTPILSTPKVNPDNIISQHNLGILYENAQDLNNKILELQSDQYYTLSKNCNSYIAHYHDYIKLSKKLMDFIK